MPCCAVLGCSNRPDRGSKMHRFPRDPKRRRLWEILVCRENWHAKDSSFLCADHFDETQYEQGRADNLRKLKPNALPTRFAFSVGKHSDHTECKQDCAENVKKLKKNAVTLSPRVKTLHRQPLWRRSRRMVAQNKAFRRKQIHQEHSYSAQTSLPEPDITQMSSTDGKASVTAAASKEEDGNHFVGEEAAASEQPQSPSHSSSSMLGTAPCKCVEREREIRSLRQKLGRERKEKELLQQQSASFEARVAKVFSEDQLDLLGRRNNGGSDWSAETMEKALQLWFACSATGYKLLLAQKQPLPTVHSLREWLREISIEPGELDEVFHILKLKVAAMEETERECCLMLDEMRLRDDLENAGDSSCTQEGAVPQNHPRATSNALVIMLAGVTSHWKQTVAFHSTGSSEDKGSVKPFVLEVIRRAHNIGLHVTAVTSSMGSINHALWKSFGIGCSKSNRTKHKVPHPCRPDRHLHFLADVHYVIEHLRMELVTGNTITLPKKTVSKFKLPSDKVTAEHLQKLANFQIDGHEQLAPEITRAITKSTHSQETNFSDALNFLSPSVSSALRHLVKCEGCKPALRTTAWFLEFMNGWFKLMSNGHPVLALSKNNMQAYDKAVAHLKQVVQVTKMMSVENKDNWQPFQTGLIVSTMSILDLQAELLARGHSYVLTASFTKEHLRDVFRSIQTASTAPSYPQFLAALKSITAEHLME